MNVRQAWNGARQYVAISALLLMAAFIVGCGSGDSDSPSDAGSPSVTQEPANKAEAEGGASSTPGATGSDEGSKTKAAKYVMEPPPIQILNGDDSGYRVKKPTVVVVNSQRAMNKLRARHFSKGVKREDVVPVSFKQDRQLVAVFMPQEPKGTQLSILSVSTNGSKLKVDARLLLPAKGCRVKGTGTRPFGWVETRALDAKPVVDITRQRNSEC